MRENARVHHHMDFQFRRAGEPTLAIRTTVGPLTKMGSSMHCQMRPMLIGLLAMRTFVRPRIIMPLHVNAMRTLMYEFLAANMACVIVFARVNRQMRLV